MGGGGGGVVAGGVVAGGEVAGGVVVGGEVGGGGAEGAGVGAGAGGAPAAGALGVDAAGGDAAELGVGVAPVSRVGAAPRPAAVGAAASAAAGSVSGGPPAAAAVSGAVRAAVEPAGVRVPKGLIAPIREGSVVDAVAVVAGAPDARSATMAKVAVVLRPVVSARLAAAGRGRRFNLYRDATFDAPR